MRFNKLLIYTICFGFLLACLGCQREKHDLKSVVYFNTRGKEPVEQEQEFSSRFIELFKKQYLIINPATAENAESPESYRFEYHFDMYDEMGKHYDIYSNLVDPVIYVNDAYCWWNPDNELMDYLYSYAGSKGMEPCADSSGFCVLSNGSTVDLKQMVYEPSGEPMFPVLYQANGVIKVRELFRQLNQFTHYDYYQDWTGEDGVPFDTIDGSIDENTTLDEWFGMLSVGDRSVLKTVQYKNVTIKIVMNTPSGRTFYYIHVLDE